MNIRIAKHWILLFFILSGRASFGQKPAVIQINSLIERIPALESCSACYEGSTLVSDPQNGMISIKDNGLHFNQLNDEISRIMKSDMDAMNNQKSFASNHAASTQEAEEAKAKAMEQAAQQQQQAAQMANMTPEQIQQMMKTNNHPAAPQKTDVNMMKRIGQAQSALGKLQQILSEFDMKFAKISLTDKTTLAVPPNCPEVQQGGYAGPTCSCEKNRSVISGNTYVGAVNTDISKMKEMISQYKPQIAEQIAIIDKVEFDYKYGESVSDPNIKQMMWSMQKQAMNGFVDLFSKVSSGWSDGAKAFARVVNAKNTKCTN